MSTVCVCVCVCARARVCVKKRAVTECNIFCMRLFHVHHTVFCVVFGECTHKEAIKERETMRRVCSRLTHSATC
jgi:hypothetical protein